MLGGGDQCVIGLCRFPRRGPNFESIVYLPIRQQRLVRVVVLILAAALRATAQGRYFYGANGDPPLASAWAGCLDDGTTGGSSPVASQAANFDATNRTSADFMSCPLAMW